MASNLHPRKSPSGGNAPAAGRLEPLDTMPLRRGRCDWCGGRCPRGRTYCSRDCRVAYNNLTARQGKALLQALKIWRLNRGRAGTRGAGKLTIVSARVDAYLAEDRNRWRAAEGGG